MRKRLLIILFISITAHSATAQQLPPGQFLSAPLTYNPATTGLTSDDMRIAATYEEWHTYQHSKTGSLFSSFDMPILRDVLPKGNAVGIGIMCNAATYEALPMWRATDNTIGLSFAYHISLGKKNLHHLSIGAQSTFMSYSYTYDGYGTTYDESRSGYKTNYNWGIMYSGMLSEKTPLYGGISRYANSMPYAKDRYTMLAGTTLSLSTNTLLFINAAYHAGDGRVQNSDYIRFVLNRGKKEAPKTAVAGYAGAVFVFGDAAMPYVGFEAAHTRLGITVDPRPLSTKHYPSPSFQVSLIYNGKFSKKNNPNWHCPTMY